MTDISTSIMKTPVLTPAEGLNRQTFLALMWALSHPGRIYEFDASQGQLPDNLAAIGNCLLDLETTFYTPDAMLAQRLEQTTARRVPTDDAAYHFYPQVRQQDLQSIERAPVGDMLYPDRSATLILGCSLGQGAEIRLSGPGIEDQETLRVHYLPADLWALRKQTLRYPIGWDIFLVDKNRVVGLPRTTQIEH